MKTYIKVKTQFEGKHQWSSCPFEEVAFLKSLHRHIFYVIVIAEVSHADRDIEFFILKKDIDKVIKELYDTDVSKIANLGSMSCEMMCKDIQDALSKIEYNTISEIEVNEDNENGAIVKFDV